MLHADYSEGCETGSGSLLSVPAVADNLPLLDGFCCVKAHQAESRGYVRVAIIPQQQHCFDCSALQGSAGRTFAYTLLLSTNADDACGPYREAVEL